MHMHILHFAVTASLLLSALSCGGDEAVETDSSAEDRFTAAEAHRHFAAGVNGEVWMLLEKPDRTPAEDERMVLAAHASCYHWLDAGTVVHHQRGQWLISRVYAELGQGDNALHHARRCMELTEAHRDQMAGFDFAYANEALARAHSIAGNRTEADRFREAAVEASEAIEDPEDRAMFLTDLRSGTGSITDD